MTLHDVGRALRERWVAVVVSIMVALLAGVALFFVRPVSYTATLTVYAAPRAVVPAATTPDAAYQGSLLAKDRIPSYLQLVTSPQVVSQVIARAQLPTDVENLTSRVTATNTTDSVLLDIAVSAPSAAEAVATANAFGDVLPGAVAQIEQNGVPTAQPAVTLGVIRPVPVPLRPSTPGLGLTLVVALLAGVIVGIAVALVRDALDRSVRTPEDLAEALSGTGLPVPAPPVLASLPAPDHGGSDPGGPGSRDAEAYRQLRTALHAGRHAAPGVLAITSPQAGDGRTTVTCSLAAAAAAAGLGVVVVDADLRRPMVATTFGVGSRTGLTDVLAGRVEVDAAARPTRAGVDAVPTGSLPSNPSELLAGGGLADVLAALHERYDLVLVDTPPTLPVTDAAVVAEAAGGVVVLARTRRTRPADLARTIRILDGSGAAVVGAVLVGATDGATLAVDPADRSTIVPRARIGSANTVRTPDRSASGGTPVEAQTETARAAAPGRAMPEPRAADPRAARAPRLNGQTPDMQPAGPAAGPSPNGAALVAGARSSSRHGRPADNTAATPRPTSPRPPSPRPTSRTATPYGGTRAAADEAPTLTGSRANVATAAASGSRPGRNGHSRNGSGQNGDGQNGDGQNGDGRNGDGHHGDVLNSSGRNGSGRNGYGGTGFSFGGEGGQAQAGSTSRHGRPDPETPRPGR